MPKFGIPTLEIIKYIKYIIGINSKIGLAPTISIYSIFPSNKVLAFINEKYDDPEYSIRLHQDVREFPYKT